MSPADLPPARAIARRYPCTRCNAAVGQPCITRNGTVATAEHEARYLTAVADGALPIEDDKSNAGSLTERHPDGGDQSWH